MHPTTPTRAATTLLLLLLSGCAANPQERLDRSVAAYDRGAFDESYTLASGASGDAANGKDADQAAYLAGMSAYRLEHYGDAERWLGGAASSSDDWIAGQAGVMLGNTQLAMRKPGDAARSFARATQHLSGDDKRKAHIASANAYRESGQSRLADDQFRLANVPVTATSSTPAPAPGAQPAPKSATSTAGAAGNDAGGAFVLQAGAFRDEAKARRRLNEVRTHSVHAGLGEPRIVTKRTTDGGTLFVVQIGGFGDRRSADNAVSKLGMTGIVVGRAVAS